VAAIPPQIFVCELILRHIFNTAICFNGHFPGGPGLAGTRMSLFWTLLELKAMEVVVNWSCKTCKAPVKSSTPTNQHPIFLQAGCSSCCPTNTVTALALFEVILSASHLGLTFHMYPTAGLTSKLTVHVHSTPPLPRAQQTSPKRITGAYQKSFIWSEILLLQHFRLYFLNISSYIEF